MSNATIDSVKIPSRSFGLLVPIILGLIFNIITWVFIVSKFGYSHDPIPLHFNVVYGIDYIGASYNIYQIPVAGLIILLINLWLAKVLHRKERLLSNFLIIAGALTNGVLLIAALALVRLNG